MSFDRKHRRVYVPLTEEEARTISGDPEAKAGLYAFGFLDGRVCRERDFGARAHNIFTRTLGKGYTFGQVAECIKKDIPGLGKDSLIRVLRRLVRHYSDRLNPRDRNATLHN